MYRCLPRNSWRSKSVRNPCGTQYGKDKFRVDRISLDTDADFAVRVEKDTKKSEKEKRHITAPKILDVEVAQERPMAGNNIGTVRQIPLSLSYAVTIHKGMGLTIHDVDAVLEGMFAHGQGYVQDSRTPHKRRFKCVGVPPKDIFPDVLEAVMQMQRRVKYSLLWLTSRFDSYEQNELHDIVHRSHEPPTTPLNTRLHDEECAHFLRVRLYERCLAGDDADLRDLAADGSTPLKHSPSDDDMARKLLERLRQELECDALRLDVHDGLRRMVEVTGRFSCRGLRDEHPRAYDVEYLQECIHFPSSLTKDK